MDWMINIVAPIIVALIVGLSGWFLRQYFDSVRREREKLQDARFDIYVQILGPYIRLFTGIKNPNELSKATKQILSFEYRQTTFKLKMMGSDEVVRALNILMQHFYAREENQNTTDTRPQDSQPVNTQGIMLVGDFLLAIRKDLVKKTKLTNRDLLRDMIKDLDQYLDLIGSDT